MSHLQHPCWNSGISSQELHSAHTNTHAHTHTHRKQRQAEQIKTTKEEEEEEEKGEVIRNHCVHSRWKPTDDDSGLLLSQLLFLPTWKSDVATNPKSLSLSHSLACTPSLSVSPSAWLLKHTHSLFSSCCNSRTAIRLLLRANTYTQKQNRPHTNAYVRARSRTHTHSCAHARLATQFLFLSVTQHLILCAFIPLLWLHNAASWSSWARNTLARCQRRQVSMSRLQLKGPYHQGSLSPTLWRCCVPISPYVPYNWVSLIPLPFSLALSSLLSARDTLWLLCLWGRTDWASSITWQATGFKGTSPECVSVA